MILLKCLCILLLSVQVVELSKVRSVKRRSANEEIINEALQDFDQDIGFKLNQNRKCKAGDPGCERNHDFDRHSHGDSHVNKEDGHHKREDSNDESEDGHHQKNGKGRRNRIDDANSDSEDNEEHSNENDQVDKKSKGKHKKNQQVS